MQKDVGLTSDHKYLSVVMGTPFPFLPFVTEEENRLFAECVLSNDFPADEDDAAISWCKYVDGVRILPRFPVHIRIHKATFERNQRVKNCVEKAREGRKILDELNSVLKPDLQNNEDPTPYPKPLPIVYANATQNSQYVTTVGTTIGNLPTPSKKRIWGDQEKDRLGTKRKPCQCRRYTDNKGECPLEFKGRIKPRENVSTLIQLGYVGR